jgi:hypothetical protein
MSSVQFDPSVGGDGSTVTDDSNPTTGLAAGGFRTRLVPAFLQFVNIANWVKGRAVEVQQAKADATAAAVSAAEDAALALNDIFESAKNTALDAASTAVGAPGTQATSTSSVAIGTGSKSLTIQTGKLYVAGMPVRAIASAAPTNYLDGNITSYDSATGALVVNVVNAAGAGTYTAWNVVLSPSPVTTTENTVVAQSTNRTMLAADKGQFIRATAAITISLDTAANLGNGWYNYVENAHTASITIGTTVSATLAPKGIGLVVSDGTTNRFYPLPSTRFRTEATPIASASTINLDNADGDTGHITGTATINTITLAQGSIFTAIFDGALPLTHSASLILQGGANITTAPGDVAVLFGEGGGVTRCLAFTRANGQAVVTTLSALPYLQVRHENGSGTYGGLAAAGWQDHPLNAVKANGVSGASVASNQVTLPAGTYVAKGWCVAGLQISHQSALYNVSDGTFIALGQSCATQTNTNTASDVSARFTLATPKTISLRHYLSSGGSNLQDFGVSIGNGQVEVYGNLEIWKEA